MEKSANERTYRLHGLSFGIVAEFPNTPAGTALANEFMEQNKRTGVLVVEESRIIIASQDDLGAKND